VIRLIRSDTARCRAALDRGGIGHATHPVHLAGALPRPDRGVVVIWLRTSAFTIEPAVAVSSVDASVRSVIATGGD
jgi:hypothetical protein